jgi:uncharacterized protein YkwD
VSRRKTRSIVLASCALGVIGAGFAGVASAQTTPRHPHAIPAQQRAFAGAVTASQPAGWRHRPRPSAPPTTVPPTTVPPTTVPPTSAPVTTPPTVPPTTAPTTTVPTTTAPTTTPPASSVIDQVLAHINAARTANGLQALTLSADLSKASEAHNALMINGCGLSHQCPGEAGLGDRFTAAGVSWTSAGENIGYGSAGSSEAAIVGAANGLTDSMLAEVAPNDGHRRNLLNPGFKRIGLAVDRDSKGLVWLTQDFVN